MDDNTMLLRMCYRASDVVITAQYKKTELWHQVHQYTNQQSWLQQVYRTLHETNQCTACIHNIVSDSDINAWQPLCESVIVGLTSIAPHTWTHLLCVDAEADPHSRAENWVRAMAAYYAPHGQRINGIRCPANENYVNYLLQRNSQLMSGAYFDHDGSMIRNGLISSERSLAHFWHTHSPTHDTVPVS